MAGRPAFRRYEPVLRADRGGRCHRCRERCLDSGDGDAGAGAVVPVLPGQRAYDSSRRRMASFVPGLPSGLSG
jgi:hypothetical protein